MKKKLIEFRNVTKEYKLGDVSIKALGGVDFSIYEGELVVILGASGAGKSTILNILGGMDIASSGEVFVNGNNITQMKEKFRKSKSGNKEEDKKYQKKYMAVWK